MSLPETTDALAATLASDGGLAEDLTLAAPPDAPLGRAGRVTVPTSVSRTGSVLPRVATTGTDIQLVHEDRVRYERAKIIGEGGMGVVALAHDHDIDREVALKQIHRDAGAVGVARFVEEVRTIGRLEHPNIIPIHDVGVDEQGNYFFVMKYVEGETLERIIERLADGDPEAHARYTFEARVSIFVSLLRALAYAHDRGILHRDIKPANVMVGAYGEVVLMDWGIARPIQGDELPLEAAPDEADADPEASPSDSRQRLVRTAANSLVGTPAYMSPEQARGAALDARSDLYAACVLFHELLTLRHYLADRASVPAMLVGVIDQGLPRVDDFDAFSHPTQGHPPVELLHFLKRGLAKDPAERWPSACAMIAELDAIAEGRVRVQCPLTLTKRMTRECGRFVDRHPHMAMRLMVLTAILALAGVVSVVVALVDLIV